MKRRTKAPRGYSACRISLIDLRAAAFQAAARVYPGASPYMYPARTTPGHWNTQCDVHWHYQFQRTASAHFWNMMTTTHIPSRTRRKGIFSHRDRGTRCSQFPIFNCNPLPIEYLPLQQKPSNFPTLLPRSRDELKPSVTVREGNTHTCLPSSSPKPVILGI